MIWFCVFIGPFEQKALYQNDFGLNLQYFSFNINKLKIQPF